MKKLKYRFTEKDFKRWLRSTRGTFFQFHSCRCPVAKFLVATGFRNASVCMDTYARYGKHGSIESRTKTPEWARNIIRQFDYFKHPDERNWLSSKEARELLL